MAITPEQFGEMERRVQRNRGITSEGDSEIARDGVALELPLHDAIIHYCNRQFPRWKYIHANPARRSTIALGAPDFTIFMPGGITLCVEVKARDGKVDPDQMAWHSEMRRLGHDVRIVRSMTDFMNAAASAIAESNDDRSDAKRSLL